MLEKEVKTIKTKKKLNDEILCREEELQLRCNEIYTEMSDGAKIRARLDEVNEVECNTELFCKIETLLKSY